MVVGRREAARHGGGGGGRSGSLGGSGGFEARGNGDPVSSVVVVDRHRRRGSDGGTAAGRDVVAFLLPEDRFPSRTIEGNLLRMVLRDLLSPSLMRDDGIRVDDVLSRAVSDDGVLCGSCWRSRERMSVVNSTSEG